jgi:4-amino-4-deoxy-L-arabinose transferase-like glycosyltransferase
MKFLRNNILIICILLVAAYMRFYKIDQYMTFLGDEGRDAITIFNILHGKLTLLGPTASVGGFFMGPAYYYLVTPFFWLFNYSPVGASVMVALLGVVTVWLIYKIGTNF